jgi:NADPH:quinone reductase-like Zn-dependent oxidoreductase
MGERRVWRMPKAGVLDDLSLSVEDLPVPGGGEVQVAVRAFGLNFADIFACLGLYSATPRGSFVPGLEFAGEVAGVGDGIDGWSLGDRVIGLTRFGGYATRLNIDARYLHRLPDTWTFADGAAFPAQAISARFSRATRCSCTQRRVGSA